MNYFSRHQLLLFFLMVGAAGCSSEIESSIDESATVATPVAPASNLLQSEVKSPRKSVLTPSQAPPAPTAIFTPPFPERVELFEPSKRADNSLRRSDEQGDTVELKGFINVDEPRVVLSIDGVVSPLAEGAEKYGVQVIRIQPPSVDLRRNGRNWRASLE